MMYERHSEILSEIAEKIPPLAYAEALQCQISKKWFVEISGIHESGKMLTVISSSDKHMDAAHTALHKWDAFQLASQEEEWEFGKLCAANASLRTGRPKKASKCPAT
ncbi:hypothetical protein [Gluconobacter oxydans]|uniref:hypothetical protein n=1 Tax=Gluconobacter oxydans TaxID=442 RepID=UPI0039EC127B